MCRKVKRKNILLVQPIGICRLRYVPLFIIFKLDVSDGLGSGIDNFPFSASSRSLSSKISCHVYDDDVCVLACYFLFAS